MRIPAATSVTLGLFTFLLFAACGADPAVTPADGAPAVGRADAASADAAPVAETGLPDSRPDATPASDTRADGARADGSPDDAAPADANADASDAGADTADGGDTAAADARDCMPTVHPGQITFINELTGKVQVVAASSVPESISWVMTPAGRVPVVKVVASGVGMTILEIFSYGPCDQLLEVTRAAPPPRTPG